MLEDVAIFSGLSQDDLELLEHHMVTRSFQKNTIIINEGDEASSFFIIIKGAVKVFLSNEEGKHHAPQIQAESTLPFATLSDPHVFSSRDHLRFPV